MVEYGIECFADRCHMRLFEARFKVVRCEAGGMEQRVAFPQGYFHGIGQFEHHVPAGLAAPCFKPTQMPLGNVRRFCQVQLR
ncbi:hypothetical protein KT71_000182 [Congregibacter litoralis KT71]|uniref:Uncharacterized protein n=1 Tax=Congregibacter litoralis KT71 TaxID=314285 RepID=V7HV15_9GAMM|nr:hypothetical protein KT71_000182 [Congregibacter litoralis KT71]